MAQNMQLWNAVRGVDRSFTKPITGKSYKGDSPNPTYIIMKLTEQLGPIGQAWGFNVKFDRVRLGKPHPIMVEETIVKQDTPNQDGSPRAKSKTKRFEILREEYHEVCIEFWQEVGDGSRRTFDAYGGTPMLNTRTKENETGHRRANRAGNPDVTVSERLIASSPGGLILRK